MDTPSVASQALAHNRMLATEGDERTRMTLTAVYRPPFGALGVLLNRVATATIYSLMTHIVRALEGAAPAPGDAAAPVWCEPGLERAS